MKKPSVSLVPFVLTAGLTQLCYNNANYLNILYRTQLVNRRDTMMEDFCEIIDNGTTIFCIGAYDEAHDLEAIIASVCFVAIHTPLQGKMGQILDLVVDPHYQSDDTGEKLLANVLKCASDLGCKAINHLGIPSDPYVNHLLRDCGYHQNGQQSLVFNFAYQQSQNSSE